MRNIVFALLTFACSGPPTEAPIDAAPPTGAWEVELTGLPEALLSVWTGGDEALVVGGGGGEGLLLEWSGGPTWRAPVLPDDAGLLWWTFAFPGGDAYAVGEDATLLRRQGDLWRQEPIEIPPTVAFYGVWGANPDDVWVVGGVFAPTTRVILHWNGTLWETQTLSTEDVLFKVWGTAADDVWAVGVNGAIIHWDGDAWAPVDSGVAQRLIAVHGRASDDVYAVGGDGLGIVLHWDGAAWRPFDDAQEPLSAIWADPAGPVYFGGTHNTLAPPLAQPDVGNVDFHAIIGDDRRVLAAGADFLGGSPGMWNGTLLVLGTSTARQITEDPRPDAGLPDAQLPDGAADASTLPGPGDECEFTEMGIPQCAPGLECWLLATSGVYLCTEECATAESCGEFGAACCRRPGFQTLTTVCIPDAYVECTLE